MIKSENIKLKIILKKKYILVFIFDKLFLKQNYIKEYEKSYTFLYVYYILIRFGIVSEKDIYKYYKNVYI
jgi:hypothetical protein